MPPETHAIERTSPKGGPFLGTCMRCGRKNLSMGNALEECDNPSRMSNDEALLKMIDPDAA